MGKQFLRINMRKIILLERLYSEGWTIYDTHFNEYTLFKSPIDYNEIISELEDKIKNLEQINSTSDK
jgi:hypothetical protein